MSKEPPLHITYQKAFIKCFLTWRSGSISKSTRPMQIPVHSTLWTTHNQQTERQSTEQHTLVQPQFSKNVSTNIRHRFLAIEDKHFPKDHKLKRIFNRNTIKTCYSCMNNTKQTINKNNKCILNSSKPFNDTANSTNTKDTKFSAANRRTNAHLTETASSHH